ncbi:MAG: hypothetical protein KatS3mg111_3618 [Pirellulaceae bacterium]|nr:MAG: hypothetical protein KatS3mg111_3618 [Pirellulaceae bacterium]
MRHRWNRLRASACRAQRHQDQDHVWAWDFIRDGTANGPPPEWLAIIAEYLRECLALEVDRSITADRVLDVLTKLLLTRGLPQHFRRLEVGSILQVQARRVSPTSTMRFK